MTEDQKRLLKVHEDDHALLSHAVENAGAHSLERTFRWTHVAQIFAIGSTSAYALCRRLGSDPEEMRGGCCFCGSSQGMVGGLPTCACSGSND
jgi:hypothetical protein